MSEDISEKLQELPGRLAEGLAQRIERRRLFRNSARAVFIVAAGVAAGEGLQFMKSAKAFACDCNDSTCKAGLGCPHGGSYGAHPCGPSPCCSSLKTACQCGTSGGGCKSGGDCLGPGTNIYSSHCWSCTVLVNCGAVGCHCPVTTTCCDCMTVASCKPSGYTGYWADRCISWYTHTGPKEC